MWKVAWINKSSSLCKFCLSEIPGMSIIVEEVEATLPSVYNLSLSILENVAPQLEKR